MKNVIGMWRVLQLGILVFLPQDVFLMIRRKKTTIFMDAKESVTVMELKKMIQGIVKKKPEDMKLFKDEDVSQIFIISVSATHL